jgi:hypothetical protein
MQKEHKEEQGNNKGQIGLLKQSWKSVSKWSLVTLESVTHSNLILRL